MTGARAGSIALTLVLITMTAAAKAPLGAWPASLRSLPCRRSPSRRAPRGDWRCENRVDVFEERGATWRAFSVADRCRRKDIVVRP